MFLSGKPNRLLVRCGYGGGVLLIFTLMLATTLSALAAEPGNPSFLRTWQRPDMPVAGGQVSRTWMWGPEANTLLLTEPYAESPGGMRTVQYFDKSRMEITDPNADANADWYVTNGLLVVELVTGKMQIGDNSFETRQPAEINVAGDASDPTGPTYKTFQSVLDAPARGEGAYVMERINRAGVVTEDSTLTERGVIAGHYVAETKHTVAGPFWQFMNSSGLVYLDGQYVNDKLFPNPFYATGLPITEAYWAEVMVGGVYKDVLMQCFERRCLTYTPDNPAGWQVEAGNVGIHYYAWRYGDNGGDPEPPMTATQYRYLSTFGLPDKGVKVLGPNDVAAAPNGDVYVTNTETFQVLRFDRQGILIAAWGSEGNGNGQFGGPRGIAVDSQSNVYVVDKKHDRIQKFDANGAFLLAFGGTGSGDGQLKGPHDVAVGPGDIVFVTDQGNNRIQKFDANGGYLGQWGKAGAGAGEFAAPHGIDVSSGGLVYVADTGNNRVQVFDANGVHQGGFGSKGAGEGQLDGPTGIVAVQNATVVGESIYVTETANDRVSVFSPELVVAPAQSSLQAIQYSFSHYLDGSFVDPMNADADPSGRIFVADRGNDRVQVFGSSGPIFGGIKLVDTWIDDSRGRFSFDNPDGIDIGPDGKVYAVDNGDDMLKVFSADGQYIDQYGPVLTSNLTLQNPVDVAVDAAGFIYITDEALDLVVKLNAAGEYVAQFGATGNGEGQFQFPAGIALDADGNIYVVDVLLDRIQKFGPNLDHIASLNKAGETPFDSLIEIAIHGSRLYVTDGGNADDVHVFDLDGSFIGTWEGSDNPTGIDVDSDGYVFVGDTKGTVSKFSPDGELVVSFARPGSGDGQVKADTVGPRLALDAAGNVFISDHGNQRVVVYEPVS